MTHLLPIWDITQLGLTDDTTTQHWLTIKQAVAGPAIMPAESVGMPASAVGAFAALPPQYAGNHRVRCGAVCIGVDCVG